MPLDESEPPSIGTATVERLVWRLCPVQLNQSLAGFCLMLLLTVSASQTLSSQKELPQEFCDV